MPILSGILGVLDFPVSRSHDLLRPSFLGHITWIKVTLSHMHHQEILKFVLFF